MIAFLKGTLFQKKPTSAIVDVQGVGYHVGITTQCYAELPNTGATVRFYVHHHFTQDAQSLFGFLEETEKQLFELLITVKGVGPKLGLTILSGMNADQLADCIARQDVLSLSRVPGIGKKTAERIVLELRDKMGALPQDVTSEPISGSGHSGAMANEAIAALEALGYKRISAQQAVQQVLKSGKELNDVGALIKEALKALF